MAVLPVSSVLRARDLPAPVVTAAVRAGEWVRVRRGAYLPAGDVPSMTSTDPEDTRQVHLARMVAVAAQARDEVTFSHGSSALAWGSSLWRTPSTVHVTQPSAPSGRRSADISRHRGGLRPDERVTRLGLQLTSKVRTVADCLITMPALAGLVVADSFLSSGVDRAAVRSALDERGRCNGVRVARLVLDAADGGAESPGESHLRFVLWAYGLPRPETQVRILTHHGDYWADLGWSRWRVVLEYDGMGKYRGRAGDDPHEAVIREKRRHDAIQEAGYRIVRVTKYDLRRPDGLIRRILAVLPREVAANLTPTRELILLCTGR